MPDFIDVLPLLNAASAALEHGQLIQSSTLSLFETTSAIEIGEPRMDVGTSTVEEEQYPACEVHRALLPEEVVWCMDEVFGCEMAWHEGNSLSQTIFTCMYFHSLNDLLDDESILENASTNGRAPYPVELVSLVLRSFLRATLKTCDVVMEEMLKRHLYDVEDFVSDKAGASLLEDIEIDTILEELNEAHDWLMDWQGDLALQWRIPLLTRLRIRMELLCAVCLFFIEEPIYSAVPGHLSAIRKALSVLQQEDSPSSSSSSMVPGVFNPFAANKLESLAPPRPPLAPLGGKHTWKAVAQLCDGIEGAVRLSEMDGWLAIEEHFLNMAKQIPAVKPYIRSLHQSVFYANKQICTRYPLKWLGQSFLQELALCPVELLIYNPPEEDAYETRRDTSVKARLNKLVDQVAGTQHQYLVDYIACLGKNRPRLYRRLGRILAQWQEVFERAQRLGADLLEYCQAEKIHYDPHKIVAAIAYMQANISLEVLFAGFDLELYAPDELVAIYWHMNAVAEIGEGALDALDLVGSGVLVARKRTVSTCASMAGAFVQLLLLSQKAPLLGTLEQTRFERRFRWTNDSGGLTPDWERYASAVGTKEATEDRRYTAICLLEEAKTQISMEVQADPMHLRPTIDANLTHLKSAAQRIQMQPSSDWPSRYFPSFTAE